jgi:hypothetical protein
MHAPGAHHGNHILECLSARPQVGPLCHGHHCPQDCALGIILPVSPPFPPSACGTGHWRLVHVRRSARGADPTYSCDERARSDPHLQCLPQPLLSPKLALGLPFILFSIRCLFTWEDFQARDGRKKQHSRRHHPLQVASDNKNPNQIPSSHHPHCTVPCPSLSRSTLTLTRG